MDKRKISIAIDGPAGAGKSTVAKIVAEKLGYVYVDTGAMYRAITLKAINSNIEIENEAKLAKLLQETQIEIKPSNKGQLVYLDGEEVTDLIRTDAVTNSVSTVAAHKLVRENMVSRQKEMGKSGGVIMDGRDIGTEVLPEAELKIYLNASVEIRAKRRHLENLQKGFESDYDKLITEIKLRDQQDSEREISPLRKAEDAIEVDTSSMSIEEVGGYIYRLACERMEDL